MTPTQLAELISRTASGGTIDDRPGLLVCHGVLDDEELRGTWLALRRGPPPFLQTVSINELDTDAALAEDARPASNDKFRISLQKSPAGGELRLFFGYAIDGATDSLDEVDCVQVADMGPQDTFTTYRSRFQKWTLDPASPYAPSEPLPDPRAFARDFTGAEMVSADLRPWLLRTKPTNSSQAYQHWQVHSARRLLAVTADQISNPTEGITYHFSGPPCCAVTLTDTELAPLFDRLTAGAAWTFAEGLRDAETRHLLLAAQWARSYRKGMPGEFGENCLESAHAAYSAYVKAGSKETLKALADLRKTVVEESQQASRRAQELAGALWKDLAVAAAPFILKTFLDSAKASNLWIGGGLAVTAALFLIFSYSIQVFLNGRYFKQQLSARRIWRERLNTVLTLTEIEQFSEEPIQESVADYNKVRLWVGVVYAFLIVVLFIFSGFEIASAVAASGSGKAAATTTVEKKVSVPEKAFPPAMPAPAPR